MEINLKDWPVIFLSYDEPNAEQNWQRVQTMIPTAQRVHGVKGSDRAHKACAELAGSSDRFWTIDGDNWLLNDSLHYRNYLPDDLAQGTEVYSHNARNPVTGLIYGNGGMKLWPRRVVEQMQTHEASPDPSTGAATDFCWALDYVLIYNVLSETRSAESAEQAWRSAFRESVKLSQINGVLAKNIDHLTDYQAEINRHRLAVWLMVGQDHPNGHWSILGARQAQTWLWRDQGDWATIEDFDRLDSLWQSLAENLDQQGCREKIESEGRWLWEQRLTIKPTPLTAEDSRWFKRQMIRDLRSQPRRLK